MYSCNNISSDLLETLNFNFCHDSNDNDTYDSYDEPWPGQQTVSIVVIMCFGVIGLAGLLGNALVVLVVVANPSMRSTTNLLIINLAVSDLLFVIFCVPFTGSDYIFEAWPFGDPWCRFVQYMIVVTAHASIYTLVLMSLDRFLAVVHPITSMSVRTEKNAFLAIILAWLIITTTGVPVALSHGEIKYQFIGKNMSTCAFLIEEGYNLPAFQVSFFLSSYIIPLALVSMLYIGMLLRLWKGAPGGKVSAESRRGKKRVTRMVVVVVLAFAICWLPIHIVLVLKSLEMYQNNPYTIVLQIVAHILAYTNSCVNPILYAFLSDNFRKAFRKVVGCSTPLNPNKTFINGPPTKSSRATAVNGNGTSAIDVL